MRETCHVFREMILLFVLVIVYTLLGSHHEALALAQWSMIPALQNEIPQGTKPVSSDVVKWWQEVRATGKDAALAMARKDKAYREAVTNYSAKYRTNRIPDDEREILSQKELDKLNTALTAAKDKYVATLREGTAKHYKALMPDGGLYLLYGMMPRYTEAARRNRIQGTVTARVEFLSDGVVGKVEILKGLGYGLDEKATEAIRGIIFVPSRKDGMFVDYWQSVEVEFNLK